MHIICAPDSFKESMTASDAARAMDEGIRRVLPGAQVTRIPMADGGEGTAATLAEARGGVLLDVECTDALSRPALGHIAWIEEDRLAVIEVAAACGLELIEPELRDVARATTRGVADLIRAALDRGASTIIVGLGGSATNDAGTGMLSALGARFLDDDGNDLPDGGAALADLAKVDLTGLDPRFSRVTFKIACDVDNPLLGPRGASAVFGPQKGADARLVASLDGALQRWADLVEPLVGRSVRQTPGAGAAGGLGAAFLAFSHASLESGADLILDAVRFDEQLDSADLVMTGEGSLDAQSAAGKLPVRVAERAARAGVPTIAFAGRIDEDIEHHPPQGLAAVVPIVRGVSDLPTALVEGKRNLANAVATTCRLLQVGHTVEMRQTC